MLKHGERGRASGKKKTELDMGNGGTERQVRLSACPSPIGKLKDISRRTYASRPLAGAWHMSCFA